MLIKKIINRIVRSSGSPDKNDLWLDDNLNLKVHENEEWKTIAGGGEGSGGGSASASGLSDMTDVDISSPSDGDTLVYNATTHKWENGSGGGCSCLSPMLVEGTIDMDNGDMIFTPNAGMPSFAEARAYMIDGGQVYMIVNTGVEIWVNVAIASPAGYIQGLDFTWNNSDSEGGDDYEPQTYTIVGVVNSLKEFNPTQYVSGLYLSMKNNYNNGDTIILQFTSPATGVTINETVVSWTDEAGATTTNGFTWFAFS